MRPSANKYLWIVVCLPIFFTGRQGFSQEIRFQGIDEKYIRRQSEQEIQLLEYKASTPPKVLVSAAETTSDLSKCTLNDKPVTFGEPIELRILPGQREDFIFVLKCSAVEGQPDKTVTIRSFDADVPSYQVNGRSDLAQDILLTVGGALMIFSPQGDLLFFRREPQEAVDFKAHLVGEKILYSYMRIERSHFQVHSEGKRVLLDENLNFMRELPWTTDLHDFLWLGPNHFIHFEYDIVERKGNLKCVLRNRAIETKNGKAVREFSTMRLTESGYTNQVAYRAPYKGRLCLRHFHLNSIQIVDSKTWLLGLGNLVLLYDLEKKQPVWSLGGAEDDFLTVKAHEMMAMTRLIHTPVWDASHQQLTFYSNTFPDTSDHSSSVAAVELKLNIKDKLIAKVTTFPIGKMKASNSGGLVRDGDVVSVSAASENRDFDFVEVQKGKPAPSMTIKFKSKEPLYIYRVYRTPRKN
jgi:hypothetical protein